MVNNDQLKEKKKHVLTTTTNASNGSNDKITEESEPESPIAFYRMKWNRSADDRHISYVGYRQQHSSDYLTVLLYIRFEIAFQFSFT